MYASVCFNQSKLIFDQSKIVNKLFLKFRFDWFKSLFQNLFKLLFLSLIRTSTILNFLLFSTNFFARFSSPKSGMSFIPFLFHLLLVLHAFFHALKGYFWTMHILGFLMSQALFCEIDQWVLLLYCYTSDLCWLIWPIWGFVMNSKF